MDGDDKMHFGGWMNIHSLAMKVVIQTFFSLVSMHLPLLPSLCLSSYPFLPIFLLAYGPGQWLLSVGPCT